MNKIAVRDVRCRSCMLFLMFIFCLNSFVLSGEMSGLKGEDGKGGGLESAAKFATKLTGKTLEDAVKLLGKPQGAMEKKGKTVWFYSNFTLISDNGKTVSAIIMADEEPEIPVVKPPVSWAGQPNVSVQNIEDVIVISDGGRKVNLTDLIVNGKITIVDFYADWCGPCRKLGPELEKIAKGDAEVVLRKVDIINWETEVVRQYGIKSVPNVRVYNRQGKMVGEPTHILDSVNQNIVKAKQ